MNLSSFNSPIDFKLVLEMWLIWVFQDMCSLKCNPVHCAQQMMKTLNKVIRQMGAAILLLRVGQKCYATNQYNPT